jgi:hypothetical protein
VERCGFALLLGAAFGFAVLFMFGEENTPVNKACGINRIIIIIIIIIITITRDHLCSLVVRVPGFRPTGPGFEFLPCKIF